MPRVLLHAHRYDKHWIVQYLEEDVRRNLGRFDRLPDLERVRAILLRANCSKEGWEKFESNIRRWGLGSAWLIVTDAQYKEIEGLESVIHLRHPSNSKGHRTLSG